MSADKAKHNHHYVPRRYLLAWSKQGDGRVAVRFGNSPAKMAPVGSIAYEDGGYSYLELNPDILSSILCCRPRSRYVTDKMMREFFFSTVVVPVFHRWLENPSDNDVLAMKRMIQEAHLVDEEHDKTLQGLRKTFYLNREAFERGMRQHRIEGYENVFCNIENAAWPILDSMLKGNLGWLKNDKLSFRMLFYIFSQRTRSPSFLKQAHDGSIALQLDDDAIKGGLYRRHILALDSAAIIMELRPKLSFRIIEATSGAEFITGDLPVVCLHTGRQKDYYFPLSPSRGLLLGPKVNFEHRNAPILRGNHEVAQLLNAAIVDNAALQIYGTSPAILDRFNVQ